MEVLRFECQHKICQASQAEWMVTKSYMGRANFPWILKSISDNTIRLSLKMRIQRASCATRIVGNKAAEPRLPYEIHNLIEARSFDGAPQPSRLHQRSRWSPRAFLRFRSASTVKMPANSGVSSEATAEIPLTRAIP